MKIKLKYMRETAVTLPGVLSYVPGTVFMASHVIAFAGQPLLPIILEKEKLKTDEIVSRDMNLGSM